MEDKYSANSKMLIVEDDYDNGRLYHFLFHRSFQITFCKTADEALSASEENEFRIIIIDIGLPGEKNGLDLIRYFRSIEKYASTPIICVTAFVQWKDRQLVLDAGANTFLTKPLRNEVLRTHVSEYVQN